MIQINEQGTTPIYQQVYEGLLNLIVLKVIPEHEKLPSVRELALTLKINPTTIQKAYKALDHDGYTYAKPGKGNFVEKEEVVRELYKKVLTLDLQAAINTWLSYGMSSDEVLKAVNEILKESIYVKN